MDASFRRYIKFMEFVLQADVSGDFSASSFEHTPAHMVVFSLDTTKLMNPGIWIRRVFPRRFFFGFCAFAAEVW